MFFAAIFLMLGFLVLVITFELVIVKSISSVSSTGLESDTLKSMSSSSSTLESVMVKSTSSDFAFFFCRISLYFSVIFLAAICAFLLGFKVAMSPRSIISSGSLFSSTTDAGTGLFS